MKGLHLIASACTLMPLGLAAQQSSEPIRTDEAARQGPVLEQVVVTAQKSARGESVQRVPIAITVVTGDTLRENQLTNITDVGRLAPNAQLNQSSFPGFANFFIRGIGLNGTVRNIDPAVSVIVDGLVHEYLLGSVLDTFDVASVEVLRGPQGILFGRNATGGAVSFTTRRPTDEFEAEFGAKVGDGDRLDLSGLVSGPLIGNTVLGKLAVLRRSSDGLYQDKNGGTFTAAPYNPSGTDSSSKVDQVSEDTWIFRPAVLFRLRDNVDLTLIGEYVDGRGGAGATRIYNDVPNLQTLFGYTPPDDWDEINHDLVSKHELKSTKGVAELVWDLDVGVVTSVSGYRKIDYSAQFDTDGTPFTLFHFPPGGFDKSRQLSEELRFASDFSDVVSFVVGAYYSDLEMESLELREFHNIFGGRPATGNFTRLQRGRFTQEGSSRAAFYNVDYRPIPSVRLAHGGRYTKDKKRVAIVPLSICAGPGFTNCPDTPIGREADWDNYSPRFAAEYQWNPETLLYASWTQGYRSGNFNSRAPNAAATEPADPEEVRSIEAGVKATFLDGRARLNLSAFESKYDDIQRTISISGVQFLSNAASATIKGIELESQFLPLDGLDLTANVGYLDAAYSEFLGLDVNGGGYDPNVDPALAKDLRFERVPEWTGYAAAAYTFHIGAFTPDFTARVSYSYQGQLYADNLNEVYQPSAGVIDASFSMSTANWRATLFGRNVTNEYNAEHGTRLNFGPGSEGVAKTVYGGVPRHYGIEITRTFR